MSNIQKKVNDVFLDNFSVTPFRLRMEDIQKQFFKLMRWTTLNNLKEESGNILASLIQLCTECGWNFEDLIENTLETIQSRSSQYKSLGRKKNIAILGGAFNPIHEGHIACAKYVLETSKEFDEVWLMPCYKHINNKKLESFEDRLKMCELASAPYGMIRVSAFEGENTLGGDTMYLVQKLFDQYKDEYTFSMIIGQDNANNIESWPHGSELINFIRFVVIPRRGITPKGAWYFEKPHVYLNYETEIPQISSTEIRKAIKNGDDEFLNKNLNSEVIKYIKEKKMYY